MKRGTATSEGTIVKLLGIGGTLTIPLIARANMVPKSPMSPATKRAYEAIKQVFSDGTLFTYTRPARTRPNRDFWSWKEPAYSAKCVGVGPNRGVAYVAPSQFKSLIKRKVVIERSPGQWMLRECWIASKIQLIMEG